MRVSFQKSKSSWESKIKVQALQNGCFHLNYLLFRVCSVSDVDKVLYEWRVNLLVLWCYEHACYTQKLIVFPFDLVGLTIPVDHVDCEKECLWQKFEFHMNIDQPVNQNLPHFEIDLTLSSQTVYRWVTRIVVDQSFPLHGLLVCACILTNILWIRNSLNIDWQNAWSHLIMSVWVVKFLDHLMELLELLGVALLRLNYLRWKILGKTLFDHFIGQSLESLVEGMALRNLELSIPHLIWIDLAIFFDQRLVQFSGTTDLLETKFERLRIQALYLPTIEFLVVSLPWPHRPLGRDNLWRLRIALRRLIHSRVHVNLEGIYVGEIVLGLWVKSVRMVVCCARSFRIKDSVRTFRVKLDLII